MKTKPTIASEADLTEMAVSLGETGQAFEGKTILITGGRGFLGRYFCDLFSYLNDTSLKKPCKVVLADTLITAGDLGKNATLPSGFEFRQIDVSKPFKVDGKLDYIFHAAGIASPHYYRSNPLETMDVAIQGTRNALDLAREHKAKMLFFSSSEIYGDPDPKFIPTTEEYKGSVSCLGPRACYDESKRVGETLCRVYFEQFGVATRMVRPFNVYGPGMQENDFRVLPNFASRIIGNKPISIYGSGNQTRTFCYISDAVVGFVKTLVHGKDGEPYNIGNPSPEVSILQLVQAIESVLERKVLTEIINYPDTYPADEPNRRCPDISKAISHLGYSPKITLNQGLHRFFQWAQTVYTGSN